jgi:tetratricopeptide (TPR) repeat protein
MADPPDSGAPGDVHPDTSYVVTGEILQGAIIGEHNKVTQKFIQQPADSPKSLYQLPTGPSHFTGRDVELSNLKDHISTRSEDRAAICVISGMPGSGKTALALKLASDISPTYYDVQLFVNLNGYDKELRLSPAQVVDRFLRSLGVSSDALPKNLDEQIALYRSLLANKKALIFLDNAANTAQIRDLLPGSSTCVVLVTSRHNLVGLVAQEGAYHLVLHGLTQKDSIALLSNIVGEKHVLKKRKVAKEVTQLCAHLPLALRIVAAKLVVRPDIDFDRLAERLRDRESLLSELASEDIEVRAAISFSYAELKYDAARMFRLLTLAPARTFDIELISAICGKFREDAQRIVDLLLDFNLLEYSATTNRYSMHDLVRLFATECVMREEASQERDLAIKRGLDWLLSEASRAQQSISPGRRTWLTQTDDGSSSTSVSREEPLRWFEAEKSTLTRACHQAVESGFDEYAWRIADASWSFFQLRKYWVEWQDTYTSGLTAARRAGDRNAEAWMLGGLGNAEWEMAEYDKALLHLNEALALHRILGDQYGQTRVLLNLGFTCYHLEKYDESIDFSCEALEIARVLDDKFRKGWLLHNLGKCYVKLRQFDQALNCCEGALTIWQETGHRVGEGFTLDALGELYYDIRQFPTAISYFEQALAIRREVKDRYGEGMTLNILGLATSQTGKGVEGRTYRRTALRILEELHAPEAVEIKRDLGAD